MNNPLAYLNLQHNKEENNYNLINIFAEETLMDGLKLKCSVSASNQSNNKIGTSNRNTIGQYDPAPRNSASYSNGLYKYWQIENTLSYEKTFGKKHSINAVIGQTASKSNGFSMSASGEGMPDGIWSLNTATTNKNVGESSSESTLASYLGRVIYSYDNRYIIDGTIRRDGSSRFGKLNPWGNFPSLSVGWNVANESFFKNLNAPITELKLRGSWGKLGNQEIGDYKYIAGISTGYNYTMGTGAGTSWPGTIQSDVVSADLQWEQQATTNLGLDLGLWNGKLTYTMDIYKKTTTGILMGQPIPTTVGATNSPIVNAGNISNKGFEMSITYNGHQGDFKYSVTGTLSHDKGKINELVAGADSWSGGAATYDGVPVTYSNVGYPLYSFWLIKTDGLFRSQAEIDAYTHTDANGVTSLIQPNAKVGDVKFVDANGDGKITSGFKDSKNNPGDRVYCGSPYPKFEYGLRIDGSWKFMDISLYLQGTQGSKIYNSIYAMNGSGDYLINFSTDLLNSYTFNPNSNIPRLTLDDPNKNGSSWSDRFLEDGSYLRLKTLQIGFTLPESIAKKMSVSKCRLYIATDNLITWTRYKGYVPDIGRGGKRDMGIDGNYGGGFYPTSKAYHVGLQLNF